MTDGNKDKKTPDTEPGCHEREDDTLDKHGNEAVDAHDYADRLCLEAKTASQLMSMLAALVLEEDGHDVIISHGVVREAIRDISDMNDRLL